MLRNLLFIFSEIYQKREIRNKIKYFRELYKLKFQERQLRNKKNLLNLLNFIVNKSDFYKNFYSKKILDTEKISKDWNYFKDIPVLNKKIILENKDLFFKNININKQEIFTVRTSGSTGASMEYYLNNELRDRSSAILFFCREKIGKNFLSKEIHFASDFGQKKNFFSKEILKNFILNRKNIFYQIFDEKLLLNFKIMVNKFEPELVHCHPSILNFLSVLSEEKKISINFKIYEPSGETLSEKYKLNIQKNFRCLIHNRYGLAEFGVVAYQFDNKNNNLNILDSEFWVENDEKHQIIITDINNFFTPMLRYETGDLGEVQKNSEGLHFKNITGRIHDILYFHGKIISTNYIMDIFEYVIENIYDFQIIKLKDNRYNLKIVIKNKNKQNETITKIESYFPGLFLIEIIDYSDFVFKNDQSKFRFLIN